MSRSDDYGAERLSRIIRADLDRNGHQERGRINADSDQMSFARSVSQQIESGVKQHGQIKGAEKMSRSIVLSLPDDYPTGRLFALISDDAKNNGYRVLGKIRPESDELFLARSVSTQKQPVEFPPLMPDGVAAAEDACRLTASHLASALQIMDNALTDYPEARAEVQAAFDAVAKWR